MSWTTGQLFVRVSLIPTLNLQFKVQSSKMMSSSAPPRHDGGPLRRSSIHLRFLLVLAVKLLLIDGSDSFAIAEHSWQYK